MDRHSLERFSKYHRLEKIALKLFHNPVTAKINQFLFDWDNSRSSYGIDQPDVGSVLICSIAYSSATVISRPSLAERSAPLMISITF